MSPGEMSASSPSPGTSSASQCVSSNMDQQSMATASAGKDSLLSLLLIRGAGNNVHYKPAREIMDCIISRAMKTY